MTAMNRFFCSVTMVCALAVISTSAWAQPLTGSYTINSNTPTGGATFQTFNDFSAALTANGVSGHVVVTVEPDSGPYDEQVIFQNIAGVGPTATITIEGNGATITSDTAIIQTGSNPNRHIVRLNGVDHFTINNLQVHMVAGSTGFIGIHVLSSGNHITVSNCTINMGAGTSTLLGGIVFNGTASSIITSGGAFDNILVTGNHTTGGGYGVSVFGLAPPGLATNVVIEHNTILDYHTNGVYLRETNGTHVRDNFFNKATSQVTSVDAIDIAQAENINAHVYRNEIRMSQTANGSITARGIYVSQGAGHRIFNNLIHEVKLTSGHFIGIEIRNPGTEVYYNTIVLDHTTGASGDLYGIAEELSNTGTIVRNNIVSITQTTTGNKAALLLGTNSVLATAVISNHNVWWIPGGNIVQKGSFSNPVFYSTMTQWQTTSTQDANSLNVDPQFAPTGGYPYPTNPLVVGAGVAVTGIDTDFIGTQRGNPPTPGAFEPLACQLPGTPVALSVDSVVCGNQAYSFSVSPASGVSFNWEVPVGAAVVSGQGSNQVTILFGTQSGNVVVSANDTCGTSLPAVFGVTVEICDGINTLHREGATVYPNPFEHAATVIVDNATGALLVAIYDITGRLVKKFTAEGPRFQIHRDGLAEGAYVLEVSDAQGIIARPRLIVL